MLEHWTKLTDVAISPVTYTFHRDQQFKCFLYCAGRGYWMLDLRAIFCLFVLIITKPSTYDWWCLLSLDLICWIKYGHVFKGHARFFQFKWICIYTPISIMYWFQFSETNHNFKCLFLLEDISLCTDIEYMFSFSRAWQCTRSTCTR